MALLMAVAHPAAPARELNDEDGRPWTCPECGSNDPQGTYGSRPACSECGDNSGTCGCWD